MATQTYDLLDSTTLSSSASSVTFSSLSGYSDYIVKCDVSNAGFGDKQFRFRLNGDSGANYINVYVISDATNGVYSGSDGLTIYGRIGVESLNQTRRSLIELQITGADSTTAHKSTLIRDSSASFAVAMGVSRWASTSAVTAVTLLTDGSFAIGDTFAIYGVIA